MFWKSARGTANVRGQVLLHTNEQESAGLTTGVGDGDLQRQVASLGHNSSDIKVLKPK